jgi:thiol-disulfide isomerase/thioredoxin
MGHAIFRAFATLAFALALVTLTSELFAAPGRPWLGLGMSRAKGGVNVDYVIEESPAAKAAVATGDLLLRLDDTKLAEPGDVISHIARKKPGTRVSLTLRRGGRVRLVRAVLQAHPGDDEIVRRMHVGKKAYDPVGVTAVQGELPKTMKDLAGKVVIVDFFAAGCAACRAMTPELVAWQRRYQARGLKVIGFTSDEPEIAKLVVERWKIPYAVGSDADLKTQVAYRVNAVPSLFFVDRKGIIREVVVGYDPTSRDTIVKRLEQLLGE